MRLIDVINDKLVLLDSDYKNREDLFIDFAKKFKEIGTISDENEFVDSLHERETVCSTYCTMETAIPHGISETVNEPNIGFCRLKSTIDWDGDGETPVRYVFVIAMPKRNYSGSESEHIKILSKIATLAIEDDAQQKWENFKTIDDFKNYLNNNE